ncbi:MAG TPA: DUF1428 domain-containing protein [Burkholderiales bacterium]|nr:DUF1428 domain-containing protein [Burkholderiales bacterium]
MPNYVDGFVVPVPKKNRDAYRRMARKASKVWREHGALEFVETWADDVKPGKVTSFPQSVKLKKDEAVVFSYIVYKSRADRDRVLKKVMADPRLKDMMDPKDMPFDAKRMIYGGFKVIVQA